VCYLFAHIIIMGKFAVFLLLLILVLFHSSWKNTLYNFILFTCIKTHCLTPDLFLENVLWALEKNMYFAGVISVFCVLFLGWLLYSVHQILCFHMDLGYDVLNSLLHLVCFLFFRGIHIFGDILIKIVSWWIENFINIIYWCFLLPFWNKIYLAW
jgi:hypothetical protein